jgi:ketosteroid isomerase-like protein
MSNIERDSRSEKAVLDRIESWTRSLRAKDVDGVMSHYAPGALAFDLAPPLTHRGDEIRKGLEAWFPTWDGPIGYEVRDLAVTATSELAFAHGLSRLTGKRTNGEQTDVWFRTTVCLQKVGGDWAIVHEHTSVPFYMDGSYRAAVDLRP